MYTCTYYDPHNYLCETWYVSYCSCSAYVQFYVNPVLRVRCRKLRYFISFHAKPACVSPYRSTYIIRNFDTWSRVAFPRISEIVFQKRGIKQNHDRMVRMTPCLAVLYLAVIHPLSGLVHHCQIYHSIDVDSHSIAHVHTCTCTCTCSLLIIMLGSSPHDMYGAAWLGRTSNCHCLVLDHNDLG